MRQEIIWEDPPEKMSGEDRARISYAWFYDELRRNPYEWARFPGPHTTPQSYVRDHPEFEVAYRGGAGPQTSWMRYAPGGAS